ncbi:MAG: T9SS type A sorting domain-containing protein [Saprospiraceae bacterium]|nr:T9SS type A sorting domain-containing protein [Saprospiraceae bacterium]
MTRYFSTKTLVGFSIFATLLLFAFSGSHPTTGSGGYTGAPNDNVCTTCHTPSGSIDGNISISGLPASVEANTTYPLTVTVTNTAGSAIRSGFQMVSLKANLANGGTFSVPASESNAQVKTAGGKSYVGHQPAKNFVANETVYNVEWTAPASATGDITVYAAAILANGAGGNSGDKFVTTNQSVTLGGGGSTLAVTISNVVDASCSDSNDGSATANATGGSGNYMYAWDNGESTATAIMLSGGDHNVTVTDDSSGEVIETVTIGAPDPLISFIVSQTDAFCNGESTGTAEVSATGGTPNFLYDWGGGISGPVQNSLAAGSYVVTVSDNNDCLSFLDVIIDQPDPIVINIITQMDPSCNGQTNGMIEVEASGGNGNFTYNWLDGIGIPNLGTLSDIGAGDYQIEVVDGMGCVTQTTITLGEPDELLSTITSTDVNCFDGNDGTATAAGEGGSGGFSFEWSNGSTNQTISSLAAGEYTVTVTDSENCTSVSSTEIMQPDDAVEAGITIITQPNCGNTDGELSAFATGGSPDYTYLWDDNSTNPVRSNLTSGIYTITVTDDNNCTSESSITLEDNDGVTLAANDVSNNTCFGGMEGSATISASGGNGALTYTWSNGGSNATENNLPAGEYTITVTDESNCSGEISIEITEPNAFEANETITDVTCNGIANGSIQLDASGGTGDLTYLWNTGADGSTITDLIPGIFSVTITDANNCTGEIEFVISEPDAIETGTVDSNTPTCTGDADGSINLSPMGGTGNLSYLWSNGETTNGITDIPAGDYSITITDENDCEAIFEFTLDDATEISITATSTAPTCNDGSDGSANVALSGGSGTYIILWSTDETTETIEGLTAGEYAVTITDDKGCTNETSIEILAPEAIDANLTVTNETSNGASDGSATADPQNGLAPYTFSWSTGETTASIENLAPGMYSVTITDANNCTIEISFNVNNGDCNLSADVVSQDISCFGEEDGSISVNVMGAVEPITYQWSTDATSESISDLVAGTYNVTIVDANNCELQVTDIEIMEPDSLSSSDPIITDASSPSSMDGSIDIEFTGGTGELTIDFTDGDGNSIASFENLQGGSYGAVVTDENGCEKFFGPYVVGVLSSINEMDNIKANVYPNPATTFFYVETETQLSENPQLFNLSGQQLQISIEKGIRRYTFNTNSIANGVYYLKLVSQSDIVLKKIIINN